MTDDQITSLAQTLRSEAEDILCRDGLMPLIESFGEAAVIGSCALDLMTRPDIDISLRLPDEGDIGAFFDLGRQLSMRFHLYKMQFENTLVREIPELPRGLYWGFQLMRAGRAWNFDLWGFGEEEHRQSIRRFELLRDRLRDADRLAILRIKCTHPEYGLTVSGMDVYDAVIEARVQTVEEFDAWLAKRSQR